MLLSGPLRFEHFKWSYMLWVVLHFGEIWYRTRKKWLETKKWLWKYENERRSVVSNSFRPHGLYIPWNSPDQNSRVGSLSFARGSLQPRDRTQVSRIAGRFFGSGATREVWAIGEDLKMIQGLIKPLKYFIEKWSNLICQLCLNWFSFRLDLYEVITYLFQYLKRAGMNEYYFPILIYSKS